MEVFVSAIWLAAAAGKSSASLFPQDVVARWRRHRRRRPRFLPQSPLGQDVCVWGWGNGGQVVLRWRCIIRCGREKTDQTSGSRSHCSCSSCSGALRPTRGPPKRFLLGYIKKFSNVQLWIYVFVIFFLCCTNHNQNHVFIFCQDSCSNRQKVSCSRPRWWIKRSLSAARLIEPKWCISASLHARNEGWIQLPTIHCNTDLML